MIFTVVRKHLQPSVHRPANKTRYSFCSNTFQEVGKVSQIQFKSLPNIWEDFILQDFNASELKRPPIFIFLKIQYSPVIIFPKYINHLDSWNIKMNDSDNCLSDPRRKRGKKDFNKNSEFLQHQETPHKGPPDNDWEGQGQQDQLETPSKKMKVMAVMEASTTPEETKDKRLNTISISENTSTSLDNTVKQENIFSSVQNKAENDTQHDKDHNKDKYYVKNEVSGIISYSGLVNQGATCYLNAVLQTLFMTKKFRNAIMKLNESEMKSVSFELKKLFSCLESNNGSATTNEVTNALGIGNVCEQQDAAEYYQMILSMIEPESAKVFQGNKKHLTTCIHGNHDPIVEIISFFSLPIAMDSDQNKIDVQKSFEAQFEVMLMDGEDQLYCENCKSMMDMEMRCTISELPDVLTLHLQRFYMDYSYMIYRKNNCRVKIPLQLSAQEESDVLHDYELYGVVNHVGSLSGGHYYADIKSFKGQQWYRFNDSMVNCIHQKYDKKRHFISDKACMLFFRKSSKQHTHKVNVEQERPVPRSDESEGLQTKRTSNPEDSISLPQLETDHISTDTENNLESTESSEKDMHPSDSSTEKQSNPPQTMTPDVEMQSADADHDDQSSPNISSNAEVSIPSAKPAIMSDNSLQETTVGETPDTTLKMVQHPEEDNHPSLADIRDTEFTEVSQSTYTRPGELTQRANTWPQEVRVKLLSRRYSECKSPQTNTSFQIWMKPEDSLPHQDTEHISTETENNHESTASSEKVMQALLNPSDSSTKNESNPPQTMTPEPEEDNHPSLADIQDSEITGATLLEDTHFICTRPEQLTQRANTCPKEDHVKLLSRKIYSECKSPQTNTSIQIRMKPEDSLPQQDRDHLSTGTENATDADYDDQPTPNLYIHGGCVIFTKERQRMDPEPHVTTHNESDSDNDNPEAQCNSLLKQKIVRRRKIQRWMFFLFGFFLFGLFLCLILVFVFTLPF